MPGFDQTSDIFFYLYISLNSSGQHVLNFGVLVLLSLSSNCSSETVFVLLCPRSKYVWCHMKFFHLTTVMEFNFLTWGTSSCFAQSSWPNHLVFGRSGPWLWPMANDQCRISVHWNWTLVSHSHSTNLQQKCHEQPRGEGQAEEQTQSALGLYSIFFFFLDTMTFIH